MRTYKKKVAKKPPASFIINKQKQADESINATNKSSNKDVLNKNPSKNQNVYKNETKRNTLQDCSTVKEVPESLIKNKVKEVGVLNKPKTLNEQSKNKSSDVNSEDNAIQLPRAVEQPVKKNVIESSIKIDTVQKVLPFKNENPGSKPEKKGLKF